MTATKTETIDTRILNDLSNQTRRKADMSAAIVKIYRQDDNVAAPWLTFKSTFQNCLNCLAKHCGIRYIGGSAPK